MNPEKTCNHYREKVCSVVTRRERLLMEKSLKQQGALSVPSFVRFFDP